MMAAGTSHIASLEQTAHEIQHNQQQGHSSDTIEDSRSHMKDEEHDDLAEEDYEEKLSESGSGSGEKEEHGETGSSSSGDKAGKKRGKSVWTDAEDQMLCKLVRMYGRMRWTLIARELKRNIPSTMKDNAQCSQHWRRVLGPRLKRQGIDVSQWDRDREAAQYQQHQRQLQLHNMQLKQKDGQVIAPIGYGVQPGMHPHVTSVPMFNSGMEYGQSHVANHHPSGYASAAHYPAYESQPPQAMQGLVVDGRYGYSAGGVGRDMMQISPNEQHHHHHHHQQQPHQSQYPGHHNRQQDRMSGGAANYRLQQQPHFSLDRSLNTPEGATIGTSCLSLLAFPTEKFLVLRSQESVQNAHCSDVWDVSVKQPEA